MRTLRVKHMRKTSKLKDNKKEKSKYYLHFNQPDILPTSFEFIDVNTFIKKNKKNFYADIIVGDLLEYFKPSESLEIVSDIIHKLKSGSKIYIQGVDAKFVSSSFSNDQISLEVFNAFVFALGKKNLYTMSKIKKILENNIDIQIISIKFINSFNYCIECEKK